MSWELADPSIRPIDRALTRISERQERRSRRPFPDPNAEHEDGSPSNDQSDEPAKPRRERTPPSSERRHIDLHVSGQSLPTRHDTAPAATSLSLL